VGLSADVWGAIGTGGGAVVALIAATFAFWQARIALGARDATVESAQAARESVAIARAELDRAEQPQFVVTMECPPGGRLPSTTIRMLGGPPEIEVTINWTRTITWVDPPDLQSLKDIGTQHMHMIKNSSALLMWASRPDKTVEWVHATVTIDSTEVGGAGRTWHHIEMAVWDRSRD